MRESSFESHSTPHSSPSEAPTIRPGDRYKAILETKKQQMLTNARAGRPPHDQGRRLAYAANQYLETGHMDELSKRDPFQNRQTEDLIESGARVRHESMTKSRALHAIAQRPEERDMQLSIEAERAFRQEQAARRGMTVGSDAWYAHQQKGMHQDRIIGRHDANAQFDVENFAEEDAAQAAMEGLIRRDRAEGALARNARLELRSNSQLREERAAQQEGRPVDRSRFISTLEKRDALKKALDAYDTKYKESGIRDFEESTTADANILSEEQKTWNIIGHDRLSKARDAREEGIQRARARKEAAAASTLERNLAAKKRAEEIRQAARARQKATYEINKDGAEIRIGEDHVDLLQTDWSEDNALYAPESDTRVPQGRSLELLANNPAFEDASRSSEAPQVLSKESTSRLLREGDFGNDWILREDAERARNAQALRSNNLFTDRAEEGVLDHLVARREASSPSMREYADRFGYPGSNAFRTASREKQKRSLELLPNNPIEESLDTPTRARQITAGESVSASPIQEPTRSDRFKDLEMLDPTAHRTHDHSEAASDRGIKVPEMIASKPSARLRDRAVLSPDAAEMAADIERARNRDAEALEKQPETKAEVFSPAEPLLAKIAEDTGFVNRKTTVLRELQAQLNTVEDGSEVTTEDGKIVGRKPGFRDLYGVSIEGIQNGSERLGVFAIAKNLWNRTVGRREKSANAMLERFNALKAQANAISEEIQVANQRIRDNKAEIAQIESVPTLSDHERARMRHAGITHLTRGYKNEPTQEEIEAAEARSRREQETRFFKGLRGKDLSSDTQEVLTGMPSLQVRTEAVLNSGIKDTETARSIAEEMNEVEWKRFIEAQEEATVRAAPYNTRSFGSFYRNADKWNRPTINQEVYSSSTTGGTRTKQKPEAAPTKIENPITSELPELDLTSEEVALTEKYLGPTVPRIIKAYFKNTPEVFRSAIQSAKAFSRLENPTNGLGSMFWRLNGVDLEDAKKYIEDAAMRESEVSNSLFAEAKRTNKLNRLILGIQRLYEGARENTQKHPSGPASEYLPPLKDIAA